MVVRATSTLSLRELSTEIFPSRWIRWIRSRLTVKIESESGSVFIARRPFKIIDRATHGTTARLLLSRKTIGRFFRDWCADGARARGGEAPRRRMARVVASVSRVVCRPRVSSAPSRPRVIVVARACVCARWCAIIYFLSTRAHFQRLTAVSLIYFSGIRAWRAYARTRIVRISRTHR